MAASNPPLRLKLLIDTKENKVLFAEVGKDFVDFLFYLFSLPVGTVVKLLRNQSMVGCLGELSESVRNLSITYMLSNQSRTSVLNPKSPISATGLPLLLGDHDLNTRKFYMCPKYHLKVADVPNVLCPSCMAKMTLEMSYVPPAATNVGAPVEGGFVKGVVTYMVMDNLEVMPMSTISAITLLNKFNVKDMSALKERAVYLGFNEGVNLLKASLECKTALTNVFPRKINGRKRSRT